LSGRDVSAQRSAEILHVLAQAADAGRVIHDVHHVRVRETGQGLVVNYHCRADQTLTVDEVHAAVDQLDRKLRQTMPHVSRVVGHAEPLR
jgi:divalent metal cation (Fe/Co/Zn/Cd) transporter